MAFVKDLSNEANVSGCFDCFLESESGGEEWRGEETDRRAAGSTAVDLLGAQVRAVRARRYIVVVKVK